MRKSLKQNEQGSLLIGVLALTMFMAVLIAGLSALANANLQRSRSRILVLQAQYSAESGADAAIATMNSDLSTTYTGTGSSQVTVLTTTRYKATYSTTVSSGSNSNEVIITSIGRVFQPVTKTTPLYTRKIEVVTQRTTSDVSARGMLSRNIIEIGSSVKDIRAKDIYVNNYVMTDKNTNNLIVENFVVAGKYTSASNCSVGGPGTLTKPTSFSTPGQTKVSMLLAYNNCITPPGNTSNSNFDVSANQTTISKIQSTYIPWSQYMDGSYQSAPQGCSDWTNGTSPRSIPSTGNTKKTHYPDSSNGVTTTCGSSGDLALGTGQYNLLDNVHVRANFCAAAACTPVFNNPSSTTTRYIFLEGTANFDGVSTAAGSGPIVLIAYGADPASKTSVCPYGGAIYFGNGTVNAPNMYFVSMNGLCFNQSKFGASTSLGGISGKSIYLSSSPGTPFDPQISTTFPTDSVPVNLAWHAARYRRL